MAFPYSIAATVAPLALLLILLHAIVRRVRTRSIAMLPGPDSTSWLVGNLPDIFRPENAAEFELAWTNAYGTAMRIKGAFGIDILLTSDPKSLQYILNTSGYNFPKPQQARMTTRLTIGQGIVYAAGAQHARHRKIMNPAFSYGSLRVFLPLFRHTAQRTVSKWKDILARRERTSEVFDMPEWLARTTMDAIGQAAFEYEFGAIDEANNELSNVYKNLFADSFFKRSNFTLAFEALWNYIPMQLADVIKLLPTRQLKRLHGYLVVARRVAKNIVDTQTQTYSAGKEGGKDVMSILIRANLSENPKTRLGEEELMSQLTTLMLAGHETTSSTLTWALYELSRHPQFQARVREEIAETRAKAAHRGDVELSVADLDSMKCLLALMKETLRYHPIVPILHREAGRDDVIPLLIPQTTKAGNVITAVPVSKGQRLVLSVAAYNRLKSVWGDDADVWRPERFLEEVKSGQKTGLGVIANIATFSSGIRNCIGWRFALIEMQAILIELLEQFEFSPAPGNPHIIRGATGVIMTPMLKGSPGRTQLPLTVTPVA